MMSQDSTSIQIKFNNQQKELEIVADKLLTLGSLPTMTDKELDNVKKSHTLKIDISNVEEIDVNGLQFILYLLQAHNWKKNDLKVISNDKMVNFLKATGFKILTE
jgi:ABC-type transporter Mla MlaB component